LKQLTHNDIKNIIKKHPITIICDAIRTPENIGMCFRVSESFGVEKIYLHKSSPSKENRIVKRTARNTLSQLKTNYYEDKTLLIKQLKEEGYTIIAIEVTDKSINLADFNFKNHEKIVFLLGSERHGISNLEHADFSVSIPMYGRNSSMNVIHSLSITLYEATNQINKK